MSLTGSQVAWPTSQRRSASASARSAHSRPGRSHAARRRQRRCQRAGGAPVRRPGHASLLPPPPIRNGSTAEWERARARLWGRARACRGPPGRSDRSIVGGRPCARLAARPGTFAVLLAAYAIGHAALRVWVSPFLTSTTRGKRSSARRSPGATSPVSRRSTRGSRGRPSAWRASASPASPRSSTRSSPSRTPSLPDSPAGPDRAALPGLAAFSLLLLLPDRVVRPRRPDPERRGARGGRGHRVRCSIRLETAPTPARYAGLGWRSRSGPCRSSRTSSSARRPRAGGSDDRPVPAAPPRPAGDRHRAGRGRPASALRALARHAPGRPPALRPAGEPRGARSFAAGVLEGLGRRAPDPRILRGSAGALLPFRVPGGLSRAPRRAAGRGARGPPRRAHPRGRRWASSWAELA